MLAKQIHEMERYMARFESMRSAEQAWLDEEAEIEMMIALAESDQENHSADYLRTRLRIMRLVHEFLIREELEELLGVDLPSR